MSGPTIATLSYGISTPDELFEKLKMDGDRLTEQTHPHDIFNFIITSAVLNEWIRKAHGSVAEVKEFATALNQGEWGLLPLATDAWIIERSHILKTGPDVRYHVLNILQLTWYTANASKHFKWTNSSGVTDIQNKPIVRSWYQYFFTSRTPDLYVEYEGHTYGLLEIRSVLVQFFGGILECIDYAGQANAA
jgi:hypothetical protein